VIHDLIRVLVEGIGSMGYPGIFLLMAMESSPVPADCRRIRDYRRHRRISAGRFFSGVVRYLEGASRIPSDGSPRGEGIPESRNQTAGRRCVGVRNPPVTMGSSSS